MCNNKKFCEDCLFQQETFKRELLRAERTKNFPIGYFILEGGVYEPFIYDDRIDYVRLLERHKRSGRLMKILRYDGGIRLVDPDKVYSIEFPVNVSVMADENALEEYINH